MRQIRLPARLPTTNTVQGSLTNYTGCFGRTGYVTATNTIQGARSARRRSGTVEYRTENLQNYFRTAYSYQDLVDVLAHAEDGKLSYTSCSCIVAAPTANHGLLGVGEYCELRLEHLEAARALPYALAAEEEF